MISPKELLEEYLRGIDSVKVKNKKEAEMIRLHRLKYSLAIRAIDLLLHDANFVGGKSIVKNKPMNTTKFKGKQSKYTVREIKT